MRVLCDDRILRQNASMHCIVGNIFIIIAVPVKSGVSEYNNVAFLVATIVFIQRKFNPAEAKRLKL